MDKQLIPIILLLLMIIGCGEVTPPTIQSIDKEKKVVLKKEYPEEYSYWEFDDKPGFWGLETGSVKAIKEYKDSVKQALGNQTYQQAIKKETETNLDKALIEKEENGDRINALLVHSGSVGKIRKINYLEAQLLNYQLTKFPLFSKPTEFIAFIARNEDLGKIRVYFCSSDTEWPPKPHLLIEELKKEMKQGWTLISNVHNHYCKEEKNYIGILAPSLADAQYFKWLKKDFHLPEALITNGFHTVVIDSSDFATFESH